MSIILAVSSPTYGSTRILHVANTSRAAALFNVFGSLLPLSKASQSSMDDHASAILFVSHIRLTSAAKSDMPIYPTEWGYPADLCLDLQADYIVRSAKMQEGLGVKMSIYFCFFNTLVGQGSWYDKELVSDWNLTSRPSYYAYRDYIQQNST